MGSAGIPCRIPEEEEEEEEEELELVPSIQILRNVKETWENLGGFLKERLKRVEACCRILKDLDATRRRILTRVSCLLFSVSLSASGSILPDSERLDLAEGIQESPTIHQNPPRSSLTLDDPEK